mmetsp:Transcript_136905/g.255717  ORF Transcript_136905/g.255717 Transcript_136905/m.255717 type:complete len:138 (+) Transcript_136905:1-414(+)
MAPAPAVEYVTAAPVYIDAAPAPVVTEVREVAPVVAPAPVATGSVKMARVLNEPVSTTQITEPKITYLPATTNYSAPITYMSTTDASATRAMDYTTATVASVPSMYMPTATTVAEATTAATIKKKKPVVKKTKLGCC